MRGSPVVPGVVCYAPVQRLDGDEVERKPGGGREGLSACRLDPIPLLHEVPDQHPHVVREVDVREGGQRSGGRAPAPHPRRDVHLARHAVLMGPARPLDPRGVGVQLDGDGAFPGLEVLHEPVVPVEDEVVPARGVERAHAERRIVAVGAAPLRDVLERLFELVGDRPEALDGHGLDGGGPGCASVRRFHLEPASADEFIQHGRARLAVDARERLSVGAARVDAPMPRVCVEAPPFLFLFVQEPAREGGALHIRALLIVVLPDACGLG